VTKQAKSSDATIIGDQVECFGCHDIDSRRKPSAALNARRALECTRARK
jgi:hypothetical protein